MSDVPPPSPSSDAAPALTAEDLVRITGGRLLARSKTRIRGAAVDSRIVAPGELFVALPGERTDGHRYLDAAAARGAAALVVSRPVDVSTLPGGPAVILVADALAALHAIAAAWRSRFDPIVVGVTGSIAKTSTKEAVAAVLERRFRTLRNEGNQNNEIGLPLTVLRLGPEHEAAVLEMGMYVGGEIADLAAIARPRIGVVTAVQPVHLSRIGSIEAVERAKGELVEALPGDGTAVLNADDARVLRMAERTSARILTYGFADGPDGADVGAENVVSLGLAGMAFELRLPGPGGPSPVRIPTLGRIGVHNALAAAAVGQAAGLDRAAIVRGLEGGWGAPHRTQVVPAGDITIVDDTYNASPGSVTAALDLLTGLPGRRVAVLGAMLELGDDHDRGHRAVGAAAAASVDLLVVVTAEGAAPIADAARAAGLGPDRLVTVADRESALDVLRGCLRPGDVVLVKASRGIALDELVDALRDEFGPTAPGQRSDTGR